MKKIPNFSVLIPTFNRGAAILIAIGSVLAQSYSDFEILIIDDGSTDDTQMVISSIKDSRIRYIRQENGGGSKARNTAIDAAIGRYVAFLDSDDAFRPEHLANALPILQSGEKICVYTKVIVDRGEGISFLKPNREIRKGEHISDYLMRDRGFVQTSTLIVPQFLAKIVRYDEQIKAGQDTDFAIRLVQAGAKLHMLPEPGAIWNDRSSPGRLSSKCDPEQRVAWLNRLRPIITSRAYWADMGWHVAKGCSQCGKWLKAFSLYVNALFRGCYCPKLAIVIFLQIFLPPSAYRRLADALARLGIAP